MLLFKNQHAEVFSMQYSDSTDIVTVFHLTCLSSDLSIFFLRRRGRQARCRHETNSVYGVVFLQLRKKKHSRALLCDVRVSAPLPCVQTKPTRSSIACGIRCNKQKETRLQWHYSRRRTAMQTIRVLLLCTYTSARNDRFPLRPV